MALTYQVYPNKTIKEIDGPGTYYGFGGDTWGYSYAVDAINTLAYEETFADTVRDNRPPDGYQYSINWSVGNELAHAGSSNTYINTLRQSDFWVLHFMKLIWSNI